MSNKCCPLSFPLGICNVRNLLFHQTDAECLRLMRDLVDVAPIMVFYQPGTKRTPPKLVAADAVNGIQWCGSLDGIDEGDAQAGNQEHTPQKKRPGRPRLVNRCPNLVTAVKSIISVHSAVVAHYKRHDGVERIGITRTAIVGHLKDMGIVSSTTSVGRLFNAPNLTAKVSQYYKGLIEGKFKATLTKSGRLSDVDAHYHSAQVRLLVEMACYCAEECVVLSMDKKAVVPIGQTVLPHSTYGGFADDKLVIEDHIWATKRYMSPNGILRLAIERSNLVDTDGGRHYEYVRSGVLTYYLRCSRFHQATTSAQCNDVLVYLRTHRLRGKHVILIVDNAVDCGPNGLVTSYYYGKVFEEVGLASLTVASNAANWSALSPVERKHAHATQRTAGRQYGVDDDATGEAEMDMCNKAMNDWAKDVEGEHGGDAVNVVVRSARYRETPFSEVE